MPRSDIAAKRQAQLDKAREEVFAKLEQQLDDLKSENVKLQSEQKELRDEIYKRCGMSPENVVPSVLNIEREIFTSQIDLVEKERGKEVLAKQIAEGTENAKKISITIKY